MVKRLTYIVALALCCVALLQVGFTQSIQAETSSNSSGGTQDSRSSYIDSASTPRAPLGHQDKSAPEKAIYLNPYKGSDTNDGLSEEKALKTFSRAKELATQDQSITTIYVCHTIRGESELSLAGTRAILKRGANAIPLIEVEENTPLTLKNITIDGNKDAYKVISESLIDVKIKATLTIEDGTVLQNNKKNVSYQGDGQEAAGGAIRCFGTIHMRGGEIKNNSACRGGAISLQLEGGFDDGIKVLTKQLPAPVMNMSGGAITNNKADFLPDNAAGGGIYMLDGAVLNLSGGKIDSNYSANSGGGVAQGGNQVSFPGTTVNMTGGSISNNTSESCGGGLIVQGGMMFDSDEVEGFKQLGIDASKGFPQVANISGGTISNNTMRGTKGLVDFGGGGIYVNGDRRAEWTNGILNLTNALIKNNESEGPGAGYASCPASETRMYLKNGVAIYGNTTKATSDKVKNSEVFIEAGYYNQGHYGNPTYSISPLMLGGTPYRWLTPDDKEVPLNKLEGELDATKNEKLAWHTAVTEDTQAETLAKVRIEGNRSATRGGGVGSNGTVHMGTVDPTSVHVSKVWQDTDATKRPQYIDVELYRSFEDSPENKVMVGYQRMIPQNDTWETTFKNLPKTDNNGKKFIYTIKEKTTKGYTSKVEGNQEDGYTLTNTYQPPKPPTPPTPPTPPNPPTPPIPPESPELPPTPPAPEVPPTPQRKTPPVKRVKIPQTQDILDVGFAGALFAVGCGVVLWQKRKHIL